MIILNGTSNHEFLDGSLEADNILGFAGNDTIFGAESNDNLNGQEDNDTINGNQGDDTLRGGAEDDLVRGGQGNDLVFGDLGNDIISGDLGNDTVFGGDGDDLIIGDQWPKIDLGEDGNDVLNGDRGNDTIFGLAGDDRLFGNQDNDLLNGNEGQDTVYGGEGNDTLRGGQDNDQLFGEDGNDVFMGDLGADTIAGGKGSDIFAIGRRNEVPGFRTTGGINIADADYILDFTKGEDLIELIGGLQFAQLNIFNGTGQYTGNAIIQDKGTNEYLAILKAVNAGDIVGKDFIPPGSNPSTNGSPPGSNASTNSGTIQFSAANFSVNENGTAIAAITLNRAGGSSGAVSVKIAPNLGTALGGSSPFQTGADYSNTPIAVNWADGDTSPKIVNLLINDDTQVEGNETFILNLVDPTGGATIGTQNSAVLTILDNDTLPPPTPQPGSFSFTTANYSDNEGNSGTPNKIVATIQRTGGSNGVASVQVQLDNGSTATPNDFTNNLPITVTFNNGETSKNVEIPIIGDAIVEGNDTINLKLVSPTGGANLGSQQTATYTIINDDAAIAGNLEFTAASYSGNEGNSGTPNVIVGKVRRTGGSNGAVSVQVQLDAGSTATAPADYTNNLPITVNFADGDSGEKDILIPIVGDTVFEPNETINLRLVNPTGGASLGGQQTANYTIINDDIAPSPIFDFSTATYTITEGNGGSFNTNAIVRVNRTSDTSVTNSVQIQLNNGASPSATGGIDFNNTPITVTFNPGDTFKDVSVPIAGDTDVEQNENIALTLINPSAGNIGTTTPNAVLTINDDDLITVSITATDANANETGDTGTYRISRGTNTTGTLTVNLNIDGISTSKLTDYNLSGGSVVVAGSNLTVTIPDGQSFVDITLTPNDDIHAEADETLKLNLAAGSYNIDGVNNNGTVTVAANDTVVISLADDASATPNYANREGTLRQAILNAETFAGTDTITFSDAAKSGTINLTGALPNITQNLNINGTGAANLTVRRDTGGEYRIFTVKSGDVTFDGLTISDGLLTASTGIEDMGSGIANFGTGTIDVNNISFSNNQSNLGGGGFANLNSGTVNISNSNFTNNLVDEGVGAGIFNVSTVNINKSTFSGNQSKQNAGGAIWNDGTVTVTDSSFSDNKAAVGGGSIINNKSLTITNSNFTNNKSGLRGGAISSGGTLNISKSTFSGNNSFLGGALSIAGTTNITDSSFSGNAAGDWGGAVFIGDINTVTIDRTTLASNSANNGGGIWNQSKDTVKVTNSTIANNTAKNIGGAVANIGNIEITNSTISGNKANRIGGGIYHDNPTKTFNINQSTVTNNTADFDSNDTGTLGGDDGGGIFIKGGTINVKNTIVAANIDNSPFGGVNPDFSGNLTSQGYNLIGNVGTQNFLSNTTGDLYGDPNNTTAKNAGATEFAAAIDPKLGALTDNGGPTQTHALLDGSPATNNGDPTFTVPPNFDQRGTGFDRIIGGRLDIGAFESKSLSVSITATDANATETSDTGTFRITRANTTGALTVNLTIDATSNVKATDYTISGGSVGVAGSNLTVTIPDGQSFVDLTFTPNDDIHAEADETFKLNLAPGTYDIDGVNNNATVTIAANDTVVIAAADDASVTPNYANREGTLRQAILNANALAGANTITFDLPAGAQTINLTGTLPEIAEDLTITNTTGANNLTVRRNTGGNYSIFTIASGINSTIDGLTIANGKAGDYGGGIRNFGTLTLINSKVSGNSASLDGGGIDNQGKLTVKNSTISGNSATYGGGINNFASGTLTVINSTISGNTTTESGGGINNAGTGTIINGTIASNSAGVDGGGINNSGTVNAKNTIIAGNTATSAAPDFKGTLASDGYNLIGDTSDSAITGTTSNNIVNVDAKLGPLADNGGSTQTHALLSGSPAINGGEDPYTGTLTTDQRGTGFDRIRGNRIDIGAFESFPPPTVTIAVANPNASENGATVGTFRITRTGGDNSVPLTVKYTLTGTGSNGADYVDGNNAALTGSVIIPIGQGFVDIDIKPIVDAIDEAQESVFMTLNTDSTYIRGADQRTFLTISDNNLTPGINTDPSVLYVDENNATYAAGTGVYNTIGDALTNLPATGGTIIVAPGNYAAFSVNKSNVTLRGPNAHISPVIGTRTGEATIAPGVSISADNITLEGFEFGAGGLGIGLTGNPQNLTIQRNIRTADSDDSFLFVSGSLPVNLQVIDNQIANLSNNRAALNILGMSGGRITNNSIHRMLGQGRGIQLDSATGTAINPILVSNNLLFNIARHGIQVADATGASGHINITNNIITNVNTNQEIDRGGIRLYPGNVSGYSTGPITITGNEVTNSYNAAIITDEGGGVPTDYSKFIINDNNFDQTNINAGLYIQENTPPGSGTINAKNNWWGTTNPTSGITPSQSALGEEITGPGFTFVDFSSSATTAFL